ncbi:MAG: nitrate reductase cytochrome c-type subunit [Gammaproteobacteria bacterium]|nr:nitrate reductase cytochrome c-type subunit [Gammaproteobacteria bacterium]
MKYLFALYVVGVFLSQSVLADDNVATLRKHALPTQQDTPPIAPVLNEDIKRKRNYPMQPPTIPHKIDNYQVDIRSNKCLSCHSRKQTEQSQAPMVSVTHYMDRDGNFLADVSPRRYFCTQCHVIQTNAKLLVDNEFKDMDELLNDKAAR